MKQFHFVDDATTVESGRIRCGGLSYERRRDIFVLFFLSEGLILNFSIHFGRSLQVIIVLIECQRQWNVFGVATWSPEVRLRFLDQRAVVVFALGSGRAVFLLVELAGLRLLKLAALLERLWLNCDVVSD